MEIGRWFMMQKIITCIEFIEMILIYAKFTRHHQSAAAGHRKGGSTANPEALLSAHERKPAGFVI